MRLKIIGLFAALLLVGACQAPSDDSASGEGAGGTDGGAGVDSADTGDVSTGTMSGPEAGSVDEWMQDVGYMINFGFDKSNLMSEARSILDRQAEWLMMYTGYSVTVEGHCDERGTREYNLALGERRASSVKNYLVALGVDPSRISTISYGKERPLAMGHDEGAWGQNRRGVSILN
jgi:peptidoglycan-associated lipoprotein